MSSNLTKAQYAAERLAAAASAAQWLEAAGSDWAGVKRNEVRDRFLELAEFLGFEVSPITTTAAA